MPDSLQTITLGGGCFWCTEAVFVRVRGVEDVESGYCNGHVERPTYEQVCRGHTGHNEVVRLRYDPAQVSLQQLLEIFFVIHDPTTLNQQGNDEGTQYRSGIYYSTPEQAQVAQAQIEALTQAKVFKSRIVTEVLPLANYWSAEAYHQDYYENNPNQVYCSFVVSAKVTQLRRNFAALLK